tara:strand:+ start:61 stop:183 length:123 start_codon:yes stop_codon:yes gene_type:complete
LHPTNEDPDVIDFAWIQIKVSCEKAKQTQVKNILQRCLTK